MPNAEKTDNMGTGGNVEIQEKVELASAIFHEYEDEIRAMIRFHVNDNSRIDDIFQDFFLSMVDKPVPSDIQNIGGYLYKAITNDVIDMNRRTKRYRTRIQRYAEGRKRSMVNDDPENIAIQLEERQKMVELIEKQLPSREAEAVLERYDHSNSIDNAAKKMQVSKRSFSRYLCMGLKKTADLLVKKVR
jgi:RNA polymerase sigma factor (sigma-70 family)